MELETPVGVLVLGMPQNNPAGDSELHLKPKHKPGEKVKKTWSRDSGNKKGETELGPIFQEIAAVAIGKNAVVVTGLNRAKQNPDSVDAGICAISLTDGKILWREPLPGVPTAWGLALASRGNDMIVTLMDGRVVAFTNK
jgi:hypothetical protein